MSKKNLYSWAMSIFALSIFGFIVFAVTYSTILLTKSTGGITVMWPVEGVVLALMLGWLRKKPLSILIVGEAASFVGAAIIEKHYQLPAIMAVVKVIGTWAVYYVLTKFTEEDRFFKSKGLLIFIAVSAAASLVSGIVFSVVVHVLVGAPIFNFVFAGAANNALGYSVLTPLLVILARRGEPMADGRQGFVRTFAIIGAFSVSVLMVFAQSTYPLLFLIPLGCMLVAYTVEMRAVALAVLLMVVTAVVMTLLGHGPIQLVPGPMAERVQMLQFFIGIMTATTLPIAALMAEHARLKTSLIQARVDAEAANRAKSVFLATISHEIRTPLNGVLGMAQIMSMDQLSEKQRERVEVVRSSGQALLSLLNDVLDLSKIEAGKLTFEMIDFDLGEVLRDVTCAFVSLANEKAIKMTLDLEAADGVYRGDPLRIRQIVFNLISNALKFTQTGEIRIRSYFDDEGLHLAVSDTGIGIPADKIGVLFSKFNQVEESTTRRFGGTGLGLSICRELSELMGGGIKVESIEGVGSTFTASLRLDRVGDRLDSSQDAQDAEDVAAAPDEGLRVLAAEDNPTNRLILKTLLELSGVDVVIVENGVEAVQAWRDGDWDIILMDVQMPVMDGPTATRAIRQLEAELERPRTFIVALTANTMAHQVEQYIEAGMDAHLAKPIELSALIETLVQSADFAEQRALNIAA